RRGSTSARSAAGRSGPIACAPPVTRTRAASSSRRLLSSSSMPVRVAVDAMGADRGPAEIVAGAVAAASDAIQPLIVGPGRHDTHGLELAEAADVIEMDDKPTQAVRSKPDSSLVVACRLVGEGRADAVVSPGNTGAMLAASLFNIKRLRGVLRPAIGVVIPAR